MDWVWLVSVAVTAVVLALVMWRVPILFRERRRIAENQARRDFHLQRERLECVFVQAAAASGKPRGLRWVDCDFDNDVTYASNRQSRQLSALVACTIRFEAIEGGGMEDVEAVGNLRAATAAFTWTGFDWTTNGKTVFNLEPDQVLERYANDLTPV
jgi:hypothetical protein